VTSVREWLEQAFKESGLSSEAEDYVRARGATAKIVETWGINTFDPPVEPCPDHSYHRPYGPSFERFAGKVIYPLYSPRGVLLGFDSRSVGKKDLLRVLLPEAHWTPTWIGMPDAMQGIWDGKPIYVAEGIFDVWALLRVVENGVVLGSGPARLSQKQLEFLIRWATKSDVGMVYDRDETGRRGTASALKSLRYHQISSRDIPYSGKDPGEAWDRGGTARVREVFPYL